MQRAALPSKDSAASCFFKESSFGLRYTLGVVQSLLEKILRKDRCREIPHKHSSTQYQRQNSFYPFHILASKHQSSKTYIVTDLQKFTLIVIISNISYFCNSPMSLHCFLVKIFIKINSKYLYFATLWVNYRQGEVYANVHRKAERAAGR